MPSTRSLFESRGDLFNYLFIYFLDSSFGIVVSRGLFAKRDYFYTWIFWVFNRGIFKESLVLAAELFVEDVFERMVVYNLLLFTCYKYFSAVFSELSFYKSGFTCFFTPLPPLSLLTMKSSFGSDFLIESLAADFWIGYRISFFEDLIICLLFEIYFEGVPAVIRLFNSCLPLSMLRLVNLYLWVRPIKEPRID